MLRRGSIAPIWDGEDRGGPDTRWGLGKPHMNDIDGIASRSDGGNAASGEVGYPEAAADAITGFRDRGSALAARWRCRC
jgi:hypothetical protein